MTSVASAPPSDTSIEVWRIQIDIIRNKTIAERLAIAEKRREWQLCAEDDFLRRRYPHASDRELKLERIRHRHGDELARAVESMVLHASSRADDEPQTT